MWLRRTYVDKVEIVPEDEETMHIPSLQCVCLPLLDRDEKTDLPMIVHNSYDGREEFETALAVLPASFRNRMAA